MTTAQIIIYSVLLLVLLFFLFRYSLIAKDNENYNVSGLGMIFCIISLVLIGFILFTQQSFINELKQNRNCPEYEKVDNVYKLKQ